MVRSGAVTLKISPRTCEGGLRFAEQTNFATPSSPKLQGIPGARSPNNGPSADSLL